MEESNGESRPDALKMNHPISIDAEVQTEDGMHREGKSYRGRGRGHWRGGGRGSRGFKRRTRGGKLFCFTTIHINKATDRSESLIQ